MSRNPVEQGQPSERPSLRQHSGRSSENQSDTSSGQSAAPQSSDTGRRKRGRPRKRPLSDDESKITPREHTQFIHVNRGQAATDRETRKAIRSHAMFAVRRDQREQRRVLEQISSSQAEQAEEPDSSIRMALIAQSSNASIETFDTLPLTIDNSTLELLHEHFPERTSSSLPQSLREQIESFRKIDWPPVQHLDFVQSARFAWIELRNESLTENAGTIPSNRHLFQAFSEINNAIKDIHQIPVDSLCYAVALCMSAACVTGDLDVLEAHFHGFAALLAHPYTTISNSAFLTIYVVRFGLVNFYPDILSIRKLRRLELAIETLKDEPFIFFDLPAFLQPSKNITLLQNLPTNHACTGFLALCQQGLIPFGLYESTSIITDLQILLDHASNNQVDSETTEEVIRHIWAGSGALYNLQTRCITPLEKTCRYALMIHLYLQLFPSPPVVVYRVAVLLLRQLSLIDIQQALGQCPEFLLWACLTVGAFTRDPSRATVIQIIAAIRGKLNVDLYTGAAETACGAFLWSFAIDQQAAKFWEEAISIRSDTFVAETFRCTATSTEEDERNADLMEVCELEMTVLGLVPAEM